MSDISQLADIAEILGVVIVIGGVFFAIMQMRQIRQQRRELAAIELFRFFGSPQFSKAYYCVLQLPEGLGKRQLAERNDDIETCAMVISTTMENIGVMVYHRIVPSIVVYNLIGSSTITLWRRLRVWIDDLRDDLDDPAAFEWFQWLAEKLEEFGTPGEPPAYQAFKDWKPSSKTPDI